MDKTLVAHRRAGRRVRDGFRLGGLEGGQVWANNGRAVFYPNPRGSTNYGGDMTAWVITQTSRFKAAMVGAGLPNAKTLPLSLGRSAMSHIDKVTTPTLILDGAQDERVPVGQAQELYRGLKDRGKATELVFYPREGHGFTEYYHQQDRMQRIYDWVTKYTLGAPDKTIEQ